MPSIKNIDNFVQLLNSLGDEPRILKERGQKLEPVVVPDKTPEESNPFLASVDDDISEVDDLDIPDLSGDLDSLDDDFSLDDDDNNGAPDLEMDEDFSLDEIDSEPADLLDDFDNLESDPEDLLDGPDDLESTDFNDSIDDIDTTPTDPLDGLDNTEEVPTDLFDGLDNTEDEPTDLSDDLDNTEDEPTDLVDDLDNTEDEPTDLFDGLDNAEEEPTDLFDGLDNTEDEPTDQLDDIDNAEEEPTDLFDDLDNVEDEPTDLFDGLDNSEEEPTDLFDDLDNIETEPADILDSMDNDDITSLDGLDTIGDLDNLNPVDDLGDQETEEPQEIDLDSISEGEIDDVEELEDTDEILDLEELGELSDEDLDTSPDSLDNDDLIKDIDIDDIGLDDFDEMEDEDSLASGFDSLSIEDEVLEDDFGSLEDDDSDEFSLGDFGDSFNFDKVASSPSLALEEFTDTDEDDAPLEDEIKYTQEEFDSIKKTLASLPLNLKIIIEEEIAENGLFGNKLSGLVELLIDNAPIKEIVKYVNKKLGYKVKVSSSFVKLSAMDFEKQKQRFSYILINIVFPKLKWIFPISIVLALLYLAGYFWVYNIFKSENIYKEGHELILIDKYEEAYDKFMEAFNVHRKKKWYYIYADTYYDRKAFNFAQDIYLQILNEDSDDIHAILAYSRMKGFDEGDYAKATYFLVDYVDHGLRNYAVMSTLGDLYMKWAEINPVHYENARLWYAETMVAYGPKPDILFKFLNYFIKTDNLQEVKNYRRMFEISKDIKVEGDTYARMSSYLMDKGIVENVRETLFRGLKDNPRNPNLHFQLARYFDSIGNSREVEKAARNAVFYYEYGGYLSSEELSSLVDTKRLLGDLYSNEERYLASEKNYKEAATLYENLRDRNFVEKDKKYGEIYAGYGDIFYYAGNSFSTAYNLYNKAEENLYSTPEISYKKGYINYQENNMKDALLEFHTAEDIRTTRESIMFAKANTLSYRGSYSSALTYYRMHLRLLQKIEEEEGDLYPNENEAHRALIENYIRVYNNMGVTLYKLKGEKVLPEVGMAFTRSTEYYDYLTRDPDFLIRSGLKDLAYYNTKAILQPTKEMELLLYNSISRDFSDLNLGIVSTLK